MKPTIYAIALLIALLSVAWLEAATRKSETPEAVAVEITREMYDLIQPGMTVEEVVAVVGAEPTLTEPATSPNGIHTERLYWKDREGSTIYLRTDGKVITDKIAGFIKP